MANKIVKANELQLADVVRLAFDFEQPFATCIVKQIKDGTITLFRPYGAHADFSHTGGVICYTGIEEFCVQVTDSTTFVLYERSELK